MLTEAEFTEYVNRVKLSPLAEALIRRIRTSPPVRRVGTGAHNVAVYYASEKMGQTIQAESHTNEFRWVYHYEFSKDVVEYWCQPSVLELRYAGPTGKRTLAQHTPDYFVLRTDSAGWEECKMAEHLPKLAAKSPHRYQCVDGCWRCPPGEAYAQPFGLYYRLNSSAGVSVNFVRNATWLEDYLRDQTPVSPEVIASVEGYLALHPATTLKQLFNVFHC
jgi:hypothetical protein